jgi:hypothetical protein
MRTALCFAFHTFLLVLCTLFLYTHVYTVTSNVVMSFYKYFEIVA